MTTNVVTPAPTAPPAERLRQRPPTAGERTTVWGRVVKYGLLLFFLIIVLMPAYVLVVTSFKSGREIGVNGQWSLPKVWTTASWTKAWLSLGPSFIRTFELAIPVAVISSFIGAANGFVLSRWRFPGADVVFTLILFGMFIPYQAVMIPLREVVSTLGIPPGIPTLVFVHCVYGIPICTLIFRNYYATTVPEEIIEAGRVDGAGLLRTFWWIILPDYAASMAGALITSLPTLVVYVLLGRWFIGGLMAGSVKS
ncbi:MAG: ABC transporter permease [Actinobacteria bacterium 13_2_20CM_2_71_6]|nr:MAG: ABC transporter permease [Actinobacteria bacterium 13_2_20CM_2_71_6]